MTFSLDVLDSSFLIIMQDLVKILTDTRLLRGQLGEEWSHWKWKIIALYFLKWREAKRLECQNTLPLLNNKGIYDAQFSKRGVTTRKF